MKKLEKYRKLSYIFLQIFLKKNTENAPNFDAKNTAKFTLHFALFSSYEFHAFRIVFCIWISRISHCFFHVNFTHFALFFAYEFHAFRTVFCKVLLMDANLQRNWDRFRSTGLFCIKRLEKEKIFWLLLREIRLGIEKANMVLTSELGLLGPEDGRQLAEMGRMLGRNLAVLELLNFVGLNQQKVRQMFPNNVNIWTSVKIVRGVYCRESGEALWCPCGLGKQMKSLNIWDGEKNTLENS